MVLALGHLLPLKLSSKGCVVGGHFHNQVELKEEKLIQLHINYVHLGGYTNQLSGPLYLQWVCLW